MNSKWTATEQQVNNNWTASEQQLNTNNNKIIKQCNNEIKKVSKKENKKSFDDLISQYTDNEILQEELKNHLKTRKAKKATLTDRAIELSLKKLDELTKNISVNERDDTKIKIVQQSIERGWIGFFEIKQSYNSKTENGNPFFDLLREEGKL